MGVLSAEDLMVAGAARGLSYTVTDEGRLRIEGPPELADLAARVGERRFEIVHLLCDSREIPRRAGACADCGNVWDDLISGLCFRCGTLRGFLASSLPCGCKHIARWRYADNGFYWHCSEHEQTPDDAVWSN